MHNVHCTSITFLFCLLPFDTKHSNNFYISAKLKHSVLNTFGILQRQARVGSEASKKKKKVDQKNVRVFYTFNLVLEAVENILGGGA